ncbi:type II toxin-antitoxin system VapB family antitoxin [Hydrogenophaga sp.]|uniref:type II toxin-antitoxin system VapB family antitoxin n=1 Tax=Hydrogenophaga sp. TaxID=1904254 RepID=UPI00198DC770|nr:type II toxin-antitoxin system VapB family antitoxin [Hydrogenophaga sp.]MBD3894137.1 type II toxin-antitoxin system VapB family antitoxin [Hydrogenophaga sp.]
MRTNIVIDDKLMADVMASGDFKTKKEAVEEGLRLLKRRKVYEGLLALRGKLQWDDSDEAWAKAREEGALLEVAAQEPAVSYEVKSAAKTRQPRAIESRAKPGKRSKSP